MAAPFITVNQHMALAINVLGQCVALAPAHVTLPRYDLVLMRVLPWTIEIEVINGTPAVNPVVPTVPDRITVASPSWMTVARVFVPAAGVTLRNADVESLL